LGRILRTFLAGVLALLPIAVTVFVTAWVASLIAGYAGPDSLVGRLIIALGESIGLNIAPSSTVDLAAASGAEIPIEERDPAEVTERFPARNPAFDVTPASLVTVIVTEAGVHRPPYPESLAGLGRAREEVAR